MWAAKQGIRELASVLTTKDGLVKERRGKGFGFCGAGTPLDFAASNRMAANELGALAAILSMPCLLVQNQQNTQLVWVISYDSTAWDM